jgi:hypothetical protein
MLRCELTNPSVTQLYLHCRKHDPELNVKLMIKCL